jgi:periplasmic divalent cation tolerance protein
MTDYSITTSTFPDKESAKSAAKLLVEKKLAACVQLLPIESIYSWQGEIHDENEVMLIIKSKTVLFNEIADTIKKIHTYDIPQIVQLPITDGLPEYLQWVRDNTN